MEAVAPWNEVGEIKTIRESKMADLHGFHDARITQLQQHFVGVEMRRSVFCVRPYTPKHRYKQGLLWVGEAFNTDNCGEHSVSKSVFVVSRTYDVITACRHFVPHFFVRRSFVP